MLYETLFYFYRHLVPLSYTWSCSGLPYSYECNISCNSQSAIRISTNGHIFILSQLPWWIFLLNLTEIQHIILWKNESWIEKYASDLSGFMKSSARFSRSQKELIDFLFACEIHTDGETNRQTDKWTDGQTQTDRQTDRQTEWQTDWQTDRQTDGRTVKQPGRRSDGWTDRPTDVSDGRRASIWVQAV